MERATVIPNSQTIWRIGCNACALGVLARGFMGTQESEVLLHSSVARS